MIKPATLYDAQQKKPPVPTTQGPSQTVIPQASEPLTTHPTAPLPPGQKPKRKGGKLVLAAILGLLLVTFLPLSENTDYTKGRHTFRAFLGNSGGAILTNSNSITIIWS